MLLKYIPSLNASSPLISSVLLYLLITAGLLLLLHLCTFVHHHYNRCSGICFLQPCSIQPQPRQYSPGRKESSYRQVLQSADISAWLSVRYSYSLEDPLKWGITLYFQLACFLFRIRAICVRERHVPFLFSFSGGHLLESGHIPRDSVMDLRSLAPSCPARDLRCLLLCFYPRMSDRTMAQVRWIPALMPVGGYSCNTPWSFSRQTRLREIARSVIMVCDCIDRLLF